METDTETDKDTDKNMDNNKDNNMDKDTHMGMDKYKTRTRTQIMTLIELTIISSSVPVS
jgi:hypothetical protein